jgi:hypothetical protein
VGLQSPHKSGVVAIARASVLSLAALWAAQAAPTAGSNSLFVAAAAAVFDSTPAVLFLSCVLRRLRGNVDEG